MDKNDFIEKPICDVEYDRVYDVGTPEGTWDFVTIGCDYYVKISKGGETSLCKWNSYVRGKSHKFGALELVNDNHMKIEYFSKTSELVISDKIN